jgi:hypothetical protein
MDASNRSRLRILRIAGESLLKEKILTKDRLDQESVALLGARLKDIAEAMKAEWETDPSSEQIGKALDLLGSYARCLETAH